MKPWIVACLFALVAPPGSTADIDAKAVDDLVLRYAANGWTGSVLVARDGKELCARGYGFADFDAGRANAPDTLFEIASITKSFTAVAVVKLAQQGKLALDDSIALRLPNVPVHSRAITLRHLLSHTSGIPRKNGTGHGEDLAQAVVDFLGSGPQTAPGSKYEYWNGGYALLAGVIERASGRTYTQYLEQELFAPAGMTDTGFTGDTDLDAARAALGAGHDGRDRRALEHPYGSYGYQYRGMGGIVTTVRDLLKWDRALAQNLVLDASHTRELFEPVKDGYALGWRVETVAPGLVRQSHGGAVRGFVSEFRRYPSKNVCIAVLCNRDTLNPGEIAENLECLLFGRAFTTPLPNATVLTDAQLAACAGTFTSAEGEFVVRAAHGVLMTGIEGGRLLEACGADEKLAWTADATELAQRATAIVEGLARGDPSTLRKFMAQRIPESWPDTLLHSIWPAHVAEHGAFASVHAVSTLRKAGRLEVLLALEHEQGTTHALVAFSADGLEILDLHGRAFLATAQLEPQSRSTFLVRAGATPVKLELEFTRDRASAVRLGALRLLRP